MSRAGSALTTHDTPSLRTKRTVGTQLRCLYEMTSCLDVRLAAMRCFVFRG